jgi:ABC-type nickel/cobalt efflux system permease component RcnA
VFGLDEHVAALAEGGGLAVVLLVALLLGLRHATDPDHVTAVSTLVLSDDEHGARRASVLGLSWGLGHATTLLLLGLPIVLFSRYLPDAAQRAAELAVGFVIVVLAVRLLVRWRRGQLHSHAHRHGPLLHSHPHLHEGAHAHAACHAHGAGHEHAHLDALGRSPLAAYGIGLVHGVGGSAGVGVLLIGAISDDARAIAALVLFAAASALSMAVVSSFLGHALARRGAARRLEAVAPVIGVASLLFGIWYALGATGTVPYVL